LGRWARTSPLLDTLWPLRPLQVLLVTDDVRYAADVVAAADTVGVAMTAVKPAIDIGAAVIRAGANVVLFDGGGEFAAIEPNASAFATAHPHVVVGVVATGMEDMQAGNFVVMHRWGAPERLLDELARVYVNLGATDQRSRSRLLGA
jgi:hypothetical protein